MAGDQLPLKASTLLIYLDYDYFSSKPEVNFETIRCFISQMLIEIVTCLQLKQL